MNKKFVLLFQTITVLNASRRANIRVGVFNCYMLLSYSYAVEVTFNFGEIFYFRIYPSFQQSTRKTSHRGRGFICSTLKTIFLYTT